MSSPHTSGFLQRNGIVFVVGAAILLAATGLLMLASTGAYALDGTADGHSGLRRQVIYCLGGLGLMAFLAFLDYRLLERYILPIAGIMVVLLALCYVPGVGMEINGERRWISARSLGFNFSFQPSEPAKIATVVLIAWWYAGRPLRSHTWWQGFVIPCLLLAVPVLLIGFEKDLGTAALVGLAGVLMMFVAGARIRYLAMPAAGGFALLAAAVVAIPQRMDRLLAFSDLEAHRMGAGLQQWRALLALGSGGIEGRGYGNGIEKMFYTPYAHTDFIFPMIGEEFGLVGTLIVVFLFVLLVVVGILVSLNARDLFGRLLGIGLTSVIAIQALINIGVTTALLPNKGMPLPFISYGGSSLVTMLMCIGILINIHRQAMGRGRNPADPLLAGPQITPRL